ncbi:MAG: hypothetical protein ACFBSG_05710 [Leptolyngbyaceae cyanobacterium]
MTQQTDTELVIESFVNKQQLIFPGALLGLGIVSLGLAAITGFLNGGVVFICLLVGGLGGWMLLDGWKSDILILDQVNNQIRYHRKALLGSQQWETPLSTLQDVSIVNFKRRHKKSDGSSGVQWFYTVKLVARGAEPQTMLYTRNQDSVDVAYHTIKTFWGAAANRSPATMNRPQGRGLGFVISPSYEQWRETTWALEPAQAGGTSDEPDLVYGVLIDVGMWDAQTSQLWAISMSAFRSGDASFFPTPGSGVVGLGQKPEVAKAAATIIDLAQNLLANASPLAVDALPDQPDLVQFVLLTPNGAYIVADHLKQLLQNRNQPLGQMLGQFSLIRQAAEQLLDQR